MYVWRALASVMPSDATVVMIERSVCCAFTQWPNFILSANTSVSLPIHASHTESVTISLITRSLMFLACAEGRRRDGVIFSQGGGIDKNRFRSQEREEQQERVM